ncbi:hypothetical protein CcaCcLH18_11980 [Colletotrichum camelliae]|nr:hypothetical protein CcaCcLH18_11980 [Colletotrichum camelliae]
MAAEPKWEWLFSPFDALGLPYGNPNAKQVEKAFRKAAFVCHPDMKREQRHGISDIRWPQMWQVENAQAYLLDLLGPDTATDTKLERKQLEKFRPFPQTFYPNKNPVFEIPQDLSPFLRQCSICLVVVYRIDLAAHLEIDHQDGCQTHLAETVPGLQICHSCSSAMKPDAYDTHITEWHVCPSCESVEALLFDHVQTVHGLECCPGCDLSDEPALHITTKHPASECLECGDLIFDEAMLQHLEKEHSFQPCQGCDRWEISSSGFRNHCEERHMVKCGICGGILMDQGVVNDHMVEDHGLHTCPSCPSNEAFDIAHVLEKHSLKPCPDCMLDYEEDRLATHLRFRHDWIVCDICGSPEPDTHALRKHYEHHTACPLCRASMLKTQYQQHLRDRHALFLCPLCNEAFALVELPGHFRDTHPQTKPCPVCRCPQTENGTDEHMIETHDWVKCRFCTDLFPEVMQKDLHEESHQIKACPDCSQHTTEAQAEKHLIEAHGYQACPFCSQLSKELLRHINVEHRHSEHQPPDFFADIAKSTPLGLLQTQLESLKSHTRRQESQDALKKAIGFIQQAILYEGPTDGCEGLAPPMKRPTPFSSIPNPPKKARTPKIDLTTLKAQLTSHESIQHVMQIATSHPTTRLLNTLALPANKNSWTCTSPYPESACLWTNARAQLDLQRSVNSMGLLG